MKKIILLDIDGVLVHHGGYRAALHAALNHFAGLMGLAHFDFSEEKLAQLEKQLEEIEIAKHMLNEFTRLTNDWIKKVKLLNPEDAAK